MSAQALHFGCRDVGMGEMISNINIRNFKCFKRVALDFCRPINIIVGDNGSGKTTLLEAIFITLGHSPRLALNMRQRRGLDGTFVGDLGAVEEAVWGDLFFDWDQPAEIRIAGVGFENRSLVISRGATVGKSKVTLKTGEESQSGPVAFKYTNNLGQSFTITPEIAGEKLEIASTPERIPDAFSFSANQSTGASELAMRFSRLRLRNKHAGFVEFLEKEYDFIEDIGVDSFGGSPGLSAAIKGTKRRFAINSISAGISKVAFIALAMFTRENGIVMVDEIENGLYYKHHESLWRGMIRLSDLTGTQLFVTTHSAESLKALHAAAADTPDKFALWRVSRGPDLAAEVKQFSGRDMLAALEFDSEVR